MTTHTATPTLLDRPPIPVAAKLAGAWTSFMFLYLYVDYLHLYKPGSVAGILAGRVFVFDVSPPLLTAFFALVAIPALMVVLSLALPARLSRLANLVVAALYLPITVFNAAGETWEWAGFYGLSIGLEVLLLAFILRSAWRWPRVPTVPATSAVLREDVRA